MKTYRDHYFKKAKQESYPARSVYKLKEINNRFGLLKPGMKVLDLGAAPGSWTLYAAKVVGASGRVLGCDIQETDTTFPENVTFLVEDVFERSPGFSALLDEWKPFHAVISDMAPKTTGVKFTDQARSMNLCQEALALARLVLIQGGGFVVKNFEGPDTKAFVDDVRRAFTSVKIFKPKSSREESKETFIIGLGYKGLDADNP
ncbi:Ribosomal RNA large subunit methyltransferase E [Alkalidesulfovibrio alkalitolerans DSM 16529]|jgi:23S rRNA (uridine2552-2'-O)-methyltransferase|uniref:Ribosomal RNA large subunit methyltransferase E n=1 Tax=Alkalidesulfovibrio alkalitolerans DSM 16529 TaxID=1121439 RepID=S7UR65_9BACT|nr:RlmE family RNA methyltransferase [Alkalidesulfovibrio alkalitolerans]EPR34758.1 Ribosomal RNA large subunit methyltransferase E [Alkalidesulfovibrio alkalitolerans DSM 16529]